MLQQPLPPQYSPSAMPGEPFPPTAGTVPEPVPSMANAPYATTNNTSNYNSYRPQGHSLTPYASHMHPVVASSGSPYMPPPYATPFGSASPVVAIPATGATAYAFPMYAHSRWQHLPPQIAALLPTDLEPSLTEVPNDGSYIPPLVPLPTPEDGVPAEQEAPALAAALQGWKGKYVETVERIKGLAGSDEELQTKEYSIEFLKGQLSRAREELKTIRQNLEKEAKDVEKMGKALSFKSIGAKMSGKYDKVRSKEQAELEAAMQTEQAQLQTIEKIETDIVLAQVERDRLQKRAHELKTARKDLIAILNQAFEHSPVPQSHRLHTTLQHTQNVLHQVDVDLRAHRLATKHLTEALRLMRLAQQQFDEALWREVRTMEPGDRYNLGHFVYDPSKQSVADAGARVAAACIAVPRCAKFFWSREQLGTDLQILVHQSFATIYDRTRDYLHLKAMKDDAAAHERHLTQALSWLALAECALAGAIDGCVGSFVAWRRVVTAYRVRALGGVGETEKGTKGEDVEWLLPGNGVVEGMAVGGTVTLVSV
ncbi:hypothetical protein HDU96_011091 [Phlyctochytrium bullatum]|nr:hypothetical protein HDU96_011091 [Phlyctochytrium bullatum]